MSLKRYSVYSWFLLAGAFFPAQSFADFEKKLGFGIAENPLVADGQIMVSGETEPAHVFDVNNLDNEAVWKLSAKNGSRSSNSSRFTLSESVVYAVADVDSIGALEFSTGKLLWKYREPSGWAVTTEVAASGEYLLLGFGYQVLVALDKNSGTESWRFNFGGSSLSRPVILEGTVYVSSNSQVVALDLQTGAFKWCFEGDNKVAILSQPYWDQKTGLLYVISNASVIHALDPKTGTEQWQKRPSIENRLHIERVELAENLPPKTVSLAEVTVSNGILYFVLKGYLQAFDLSEQRFLYSKKLRGEYTPIKAPVVKDGRVFVQSYSTDLDVGYIEVLHATHGSHVASPKKVRGNVFFSNQSWNGDTLLVGSSYGTLYGFDFPKNSMTSSPKRFLWSIVN